MTGFSGLVSKLTAWALLALLVSLVVSQLVLPVYDAYTHLRSDLLRKERLSARFAVENSNLESRLENSDADDTREAVGLLLSSTDPGLAGTELRDFFAEALAASGGAAQSTQNLVTQAVGGLHGTALRVSMTATLEQLHQLLYHLESQYPYLFVDGLNIQTVRRSQSNASNDASLRIQLNAVGYFLAADS